MLFLPRRVRQTSTDLEVSSSLLDRRARDERFYHSRSPCRRFEYCLIGLAARPPPKVVRNPLRSDLTLPLCSGSCQLNIWIGNSGPCYRRWNMTLSAGLITRKMRLSVASSTGRDSSKPVFLCTCMFHTRARRPELLSVHSNNHKSIISAYTLFM